MYFVIKLNGRYLDKEYTKSELDEAITYIKRLRSIYGKNHVHLIKMRKIDIEEVEA